MHSSLTIIYVYRLKKAKDFAALLKRKRDGSITDSNHQPVWYSGCCAFRCAPATRSEISPSQETRKSHQPRFEPSRTRGAVTTLKSVPAALLSGRNSRQRIGEGSASSPGSRSNPGTHLDLLASPDGKVLYDGVHDKKDGRWSSSRVFSDQSGIIFLGAAASLNR